MRPLRGPGAVDPRTGRRFESPRDPGVLGILGVLEGRTVGGGPWREKEEGSTERRRRVGVDVSVVTGSQRCVAPGVRRRGFRSATREGGPSLGTGTPPPDVRGGFWEDL